MIKTEKPKSAKQIELIEKLEEVAQNWETKDWTVSQDDIHFCVHMLDTHEQEFGLISFFEFHSEPLRVTIFRHHYFVFFSVLFRNGDLPK